MLASLTDPGNSPFVPEIFGVCYERDTTSIVQELALFGALKGALKTPDLGPRITMEHKLPCAMQIARAMDFLVSAHVVHADLSCRNVLLFHLEDPPMEIIVKVADFGLSLVLQDGVDSERRKQPQATRWCAPETIAHMKLSHRSDVWAFGTTLWELINHGTAPWVRRDKRADVAARLRDLAEHGGMAEGGTDVSEDFPAAPGSPPGLHEALLACLQVDEFARPTFAQLAEQLGRLLEEAQGPNQLVKVPGRMESDGKAVPTPTTTLPSSRERSPTMDGQDAMTGGTKPWANFEDENHDEFSDRFRALKTFLQSDRCREAVGDEAVRTMWLELDEAQAREAYLMDLIRRMQMAATESREIEMDREDPDSPFYRSYMSNTSGSHRRAESPYGAPLTGPLSAPLSTSYTTLPVQPLSESEPKSPLLLSVNGVRSALVPPPLGLGASAPPSRGLMASVASHDHFVPLTPAGASSVEYAAPLPPHDGMWTLWSFIGSHLRRQDFHSEADAWAAFDLITNQPCMLRDPSGAEAAARSWVASYFQLLPGGILDAGSNFGDARRRLASPQRPLSRSGCSVNVSPWTTV